MLGASFQIMLNRNCLCIINHSDIYKAKLIGILIQIISNFLDTFIQRSLLCAADNDLHSAEGGIILIPCQLFKRNSQFSVLGKHLITRVFFIVLLITNGKIVAARHFERHLQTLYTVGLFIAEQNLRIFKGGKIVIHLRFTQNAAQAVFEAFHSCGNAITCSPCGVQSLCGRHDRHKEHGNFKYSMRIFIVLNEIAVLFVVSDILRSFGLLIMEVTFTRKEIVPKPIRSQPTRLILGAIFRDIPEEALCFVGRVLHKTEHGALRCGEVFRNTGKQTYRHWMHRAQLIDFFADFIVQARNIR